MHVTETDLTLGDGRVLHVYDTGGGDRLPVVWHHGTPNIGAPPVPLFEAADRLGLRWVSYDRPGYGGSTPAPGRSVGDAASDVVTVADRLGVDRFAVLGHSGGGPHALACAAKLSERVLGAVDISGPAPYDAEGLDFLAGTAESGVGEYTAAAQGRAALEEHLASTPEDADFGFNPDDEAALGGNWAWFLDVVRPALAAGPAGMIDDDLAAVAPWGFDPADISVPVLVLHGGRDRVVPPAHGEWLAGQIPRSELRLVPAAGHITVMDAAADALSWIAARIEESP